ncbi:MAG: hypothetical protein AMXMBFR46_28750 [Acidimicrobiia bacterium]
MVAVGVVGIVTSGGSDDSSAAEPSTRREAPPATASATTPPTTPRTTPPTTPTPTTSPTTPPTETPQAFFASLAGAFAANDDAFLYDRLHPLVLTRYGADQCRAYFANQSVPNFRAEVIGVRAPEPWDWTLDGRTDRLPSAVPVRVRIADDGATFRETEAHLVLVGNQLRWFTDCGTPI